MTAAKLHLEIITPTGVKLTVGIKELTAPSVSGQFGVLPGHRPLLASLATGLIAFQQTGQPERQVAVGPGYVQVNNDRAIVLTDRFSEKDAVDPVGVRLELKDVDDKLEHFSGDRDSSEHAELVARQLWAAALLELYGDPPPPTMMGFDQTPPPEDLSASGSAE